PTRAFSPNRATSPTPRAGCTAILPTRKALTASFDARCILGSPSRLPRPGEGAPRDGMQRLDRGSGPTSRTELEGSPQGAARPPRDGRPTAVLSFQRSEEHTSELQSREN